MPHFSAATTRPTRAPDSKRVRSPSTRSQLHLKSPYKAKDAERIRDWAELLTATPDYYELIQDAGAALRQVSTNELPDEKLLLCLVGYFTAPTARWPGESHLKSALKDINPVARRKFPGMGRPLASEFLRNLGWNGYKPDRHIIRLFREWTGDELPDRFDEEARRLCGLIGRRDKDLRADVHSALLRIDAHTRGRLLP